MRLFLCRHGNTFGPDQQGGERIFMCGSKNNIPLVKFGRAQARNMAKYLTDNNIKPTAIYANHLIRIWEYAEIIKEYFWENQNIEIPLSKDERLLELDYGNWAGLTSSEVIAKFGQQAWDDWQNKRIIPNYAPHNWEMTREKIIENIRSFFDDLKNKHLNETVIAIGSQGSITFANEMFVGGMEQAIKDNHYKIKTGCFAEISYDNDKWNLISWNKNPKDFL
ncbi:MAG: histidine phosphatase family protein [Gammaproteobacteria bacterium]|jgi:probable phosphoglycerate mutase